MAINVVCPGCLKRFKVSDRFAGMKGPCPNCNTVIEIPKAALKIHGAEDFEQGGRSATGKLILKPISRLNMDFDPKTAGIAAIGTLFVFLIALMFGTMSMSIGMRDAIGTVGLFLIAFPISLVAYQMLRDREELFMLSGMDLYKKTGLAAFVYFALWVFFEFLLWYMSANVYFVWICFAVVACLAMLATHAILDINVGSSLLHFLTFSVCVILLRWALGLGWIWVIAETARNSGAPPPPVLPGM